MALLTPKKTADLLGRSERHVYYLLDMGVLEAIHVRRALRVFPESVNAYVKSRNARRAFCAPDGFIYQGCGAFLFDYEKDSLPDDKEWRNPGLQSSRGSGLEYQPGRPNSILLKKVKPIDAQLQLDLSA